MNLKESFRYQKYLSGLMYNAASSIQNREHCLKTTKKHLMSQVNPDAEDRTEVIKPDTPFFKNDDVIRFMQYLIDEKQRLSDAIADAKRWTLFDIDAAIEANKMRQSASEAIRSMLRYNASKRVESGKSWKFGVDGVQSAYYYDVEVETEEAFDRDASKAVMRDLNRNADKVSAELDSALINTEVKYTPPFDVNEPFEDVMAEYLML